MNTKPIKNFIELVRKAQLKKDRTIKLSIDDATNLQAELSLLLLELKDSKKEDNSVQTLDGGSFK